MPETTTTQPHGIYANLSFTAGPLVERDPLCAICFADMTTEEQVLTHTNGTCLRSFHVTCLEQCFYYQENQNQHPSCPNCRSSFDLRPYEELQPSAQFKARKDQITAELMDMLHSALVTRAENDHAQIADEFKRVAAVIYARARNDVQRGIADVDRATEAFERAATVAFAEIHNQVVQERARSMLAYYPAGGMRWSPRGWSVDQRHLGRLHIGVNWSVNVTFLSVVSLFIMLYLTWCLKVMTNFDLEDWSNVLTLMSDVGWMDTIFNMLKDAFIFAIGGIYVMMFIDVATNWIRRIGRRKEDRA